MGEVGLRKEGWGVEALAGGPWRGNVGVGHAHGEGKDVSQ